MPVMNGIEATARLRQMGVGVPIIGLTADITKETYNAGIDSDMNDILLKPLKFRAFVECINKWVDVEKRERERGSIVCLVSFLVF